MGLEQAETQKKVGAKRKKSEKLEIRGKVQIFEKSDQTTNLNPAL